MGVRERRDGRGEIRKTHVRVPQSRDIFQGVKYRRSTIKDEQKDLWGEHSWSV